MIHKGNKRSRILIHAQQLTTFWSRFICVFFFSFFSMLFTVWELLLLQVIFKLLERNLENVPKRVSVCVLPICWHSAALSPPLFFSLVRVRQFEKNETAVKSVCLAKWQDVQFSIGRTFLLSLPHSFRMDEYDINMIYLIFFSLFRLFDVAF